MRHSIAALGLGLLAALVLVLPAGAGRTWCFADPVVQLNDAAVQIDVGVPVEYQLFVTGPVLVTVATPAGVERETLYLDLGFNRHGEVVRYVDTGATVAADGSFPVEIVVEVPVDKTLLRVAGLSPKVPVQVIVNANGELVYDEAGVPGVVDGQTVVVEGDNGRARVGIVVRP